MQVQTETDWNKKLISAVWNGDAQLFEQAISQGADRNTISKYGEPAVYLAIRTQHIDLAEKLIKMGANPNAMDTNDQSVLICAMGEDQIDFVETLIDAGANPNTTDGNGRNALMMAISQASSVERMAMFDTYKTHKNELQKYKNIAIKLIEAGIDLHATDNDGKTAAMIATEKQQTEFVNIIENKLTAYALQEDGSVSKHQHMLADGQTVQQIFNFQTRKVEYSTKGQTLISNSFDDFVQDSIPYQAIIAAWEWAQQQPEGKNIAFPFDKR